MDLSVYQQQMQKALDYLHTELNGLQVGKASTVMLENINVEASYGTMKIPQMAHVAVLDAQTLKVEPWDKKECKNIEKAIYDAELGLAPKNEGDYVLIKVPEITQERRQDMVKKIKSMGEDTKAHIRIARQDALKVTKKLLEDKETSEDEHKNNEIDIDNLTKKINEGIDILIKEKSEMILTI